MDIIEIVILSLILIFISTALGSELVFFFKRNFSERVSNTILGLASGIMIAAGVFGLLIPSIEEADSIYGSIAVVPVVVGFILGGLLLTLLDKIIPHFHKPREEEEGIEVKNLSRHIKFFFAVLIHNIPEGLAVGFSCGLALKLNDMTAAMSALSLAIGMSIQNFPEGAAVSIPLLDEGMSKPKAFLFGSLTGIVEPIFGLIGILLATSLYSLMPWLLAFSAGAMFYVTIDELLPSACKGNHAHFGLWAFMVGFSLMLILELML